MRIGHTIEDERGTTTMEYALVAAAIAGAIVITVVSLGGKVNTTFSQVGTTIPK